MKTLQYNDILDRLKEVLNLASDTELANALGVSKSTVSNWRKRNTTDLPLLFSQCEHVDLNWLVFGERLTPQNEGKEDSSDDKSPLFEKSFAQVEEEIGRLKERLAHFEERLSRYEQNDE